MIYIIIKYLISKLFNYFKIFEENKCNDGKLPTVIAYEVFPIDKNQGIIQLVKGKTIQSILDTGNSLRKSINFQNNEIIQNYHNSLGDEFLIRN